MYHMKRKLLIFFLLSNLSLFAQNIAITDNDTYTAESSAMLDVMSTTKGMLVPRLTTAQRNAITNKATGLLVFDTTEGSFYFYNGTQWVNLTSGNASGVLGYTAPDKVYLSDVNDKFGIGTIAPTNKLDVKADGSNGIDQAIFNVVNNEGDTVFAVYPYGVRVYLFDDPSATRASTTKGGFVVGGYNRETRGLTYEFLNVSPDAVKVKVEKGGIARASTTKGGFVVGGFNRETRGESDLLKVSNDSTRLYVEGDEGFAIDNIASGSEGRYMDLTPENYLIGHESGQSLTATGLYNSFYGYRTAPFATTATKNVLIGYESGNLLTTGSQNVFIGNLAGTICNSGSQNIFIGSGAGQNETTGSSNIYIGTDAGKNSSAALYNIFVGSSTGLNNTSGISNSFVGYAAGYYNTDGYRNSAFGHNALLRNVNGYYNSVFGADAAKNSKGNSNCVFGYRAGEGTSSFPYASYEKNVIMGAYSGMQLTTGSNNCFYGYYSGYDATTANYSSAFGAYALEKNTTGTHNTAFGYEALDENTTGQQNVAIGNQTLSTSSNISSNTAVGYASLASCNGSGNTAVGNFALRYLQTSGDNNTSLGAYAGGTTWISAISNSTAIGRSAVLTASNQVRIGNTSVTSIGGQVGWSTLSDKRFKTNIRQDVVGLDFILKLKPVTYNIDADKFDRFLGIPDSLRLHNANMEKATIKYTGFIAQEVERAAIESNYDFSGIDKPKNENDHYSLRYSEFVVPLVKSIQEQQEIIENQNIEIENLKSELEQLRSIVNSIVNEN